ncbi:MAG: aa3-type cytochrome c oxidase subunit IV [Beijerinckiaceae bacterium]|jgi:hypothetical protein
MVDELALSAGHPDMDYAEHEKTYRLFLTLFKYGAIGVIAIMILLAVLWG